MDTSEFKRARAAIDNADLILIGASNGLDMAEGLNVFAPDQHFMDTYADLARATGARSVLEGIFATAKDPSLHWAWVARFVQAEYIDHKPGVALAPLAELVGGKEVFAITCNIDRRLEKAGIDPARILETEGSMLDAACSAGCCDERFPITAIVSRLNDSVSDGRIDERLIPRCPHCAAALAPAVDERRIARPDSALRRAMQAFDSAVQSHRNGNVAVLELGVGLRNGVVKQMLFNAVSGLDHVTYIISNYNQVVVPPGLEHCTIGIPGDMGRTFERIQKAQ